MDKVPMISLGEPPGAELSRWAALVLTFNVLLILLFASSTFAAESPLDQFCSSARKKVDFEFVLASKVVASDKFEMARILVPKLTEFLDAQRTGPLHPEEVKVVVGLVIDKTGRVALAERLEPVSATKYDYLVEGLNQKVLFQPAALNGEAANACVLLPLSFRLRG